MAVGKRSWESIHDPANKSRRRAKSLWRFSRFYASSVAGMRHRFDGLLSVTFAPATCLQIFGLCCGSIATGRASLSRSLVFADVSGTVEGSTRADDLWAQRLLGS